MRIVFLGLLIDSIKQIVAIPEEKVTRAIALIHDLLSKVSRKVTVQDLQKLCGFLNFLCRSVIPGRAFTRQLYANTSSGKKKKLKPYHHIRITQEMHLDLEMWLIFLVNPNVYCRPFMDFTRMFNAQDIQFFTDVSKTIGLGCICGDQWMHGKWNKSFSLNKDPSIAYLELFALSAGLLAWIHQFCNKQVILNCNNQGVVEMINTSSSRCKNCMVLIRLITLQCMNFNTRVFARHVSGISNDLSDSLSHDKLEKFFTLAKARNLKFTAMPTPIPDNIWPPEKRWC